MSESTQEHGPTQRHEPGKAGSAPTGMLAGKNKFYVIGALAAIAVLVFVFVKKSNSNASTSSSTTPGTLDPATLAALQSALMNQASQPSAYTVPPSTNTGTTSTSSTPTSGVPNTPAAGSVSISIPNGALGWETAVFPNQAALDAWNQWNSTFASTHGGRADAYRSEWNTELTSLGAYNATGGPWNPPTQGTGNPYDAQ